MASSPGFFKRFKDLFSTKKKTDSTTTSTIDIYRHQLAENSKNFRIRIKLAELLLTIGEKEEAIAEYGTAARLYLDHGFSPMAIAVYKKIIKVDPGHVDGNLQLARIYQRENLFADAIIYYQRVFELYQQDDQPNEALGILEKILEIAPDKEKFRRMMHRLFPDFQEAEKSVYSDIIVAEHSENNDNLKVNTAEGEDFFDLSAELSGELNTLDSEIDQENADIDNEEDIGVEQIFQTLKKTFAEESDKIPDDDINQQKFHYNMALAYSELGMTEQALEESTIALQFASFRVPALLLRGRIFRETGDLQESLSQFQQGLRERGLRRQDFLSFKYELGLTFKQMDDPLRALESFREAYSIDPEFQNVAEEISSLEEGIEIL
ncbi:MAG TPA: tetratricopeptide repeat protein [Proteobacteria bacterium]|nr:tetratricopeptide repeat protein [Pseudomonadota bacterium]